MNWTEALDMNNIKQIREKTGLSQSKFAAKFHIPTINVSLWEQGVNNPTDYTEYLIQRVLELEEKLKESQPDQSEGNTDD